MSKFKFKMFVLLNHFEQRERERESQTERKKVKIREIIKKVERGKERGTKGSGRERKEGGRDKEGER